MAKRYFKKYAPGGSLASLARTPDVKIPYTGPQPTPLSLFQKLGAVNSRLSGIAGGGLGGIANGAVNMVNSMMNPNGNSTGVGNALSAVGSLASNIPGIGGLIGAGVNMVGGLFNAAFGSNLNEEFINQTESETAQQAGYTSSAKDNASLLSDWASYTDKAHVSQSDVGSDGWFSDKAKDKTKELNRAIDIANFRAYNSLVNTAENVDTANDMNILANFASDGGPIHIKKKNRGKFTALKKRTGKSASWFKAHGTPAQKKMATFALNARKWKHEDGGPLFTHGGIWDNGLTYINEGGSHEENPFEGVQMGVDPQGIPNLVEEGEVVYNDYVFSNRMKVPKDVKKRLKVRGDTFAEAAKELSKESEERPNDPISKNGLDAFMSTLSEGQEELRMKNENRRANRYAKGGKLGKLFDGTGGSSNRLRTYSNFTPLSNDAFYTPEYMGFWNWYKNNSSTDEGKKWLQRINSGEFGSIGGNTFTPEDIIRLSHDYKKGPVHNAFTLAASQFNKERPPISPFAPLKINDNVDAKALKDLKVPVEPASEEIYIEPRRSLSYLRYAPAIMSGISAFSDIFSKPDYSAAGRVASIDIQPALVGTDPIGQYLSYKPLDRMFYINQLNKNAAATRRAVNNNSGGNRAAALAGILASDANYGENLGKLARQAEEYNQALKERVVGFNRQTDMFNSQQSIQAQTANQASRNSATQMRLAQAERVAQLRQAARDAYNARRSNNLNSFITNLGNIGWEERQGEWLDNLADRGVLLMDTSGRYTGGSRAKGGKLKRRRRNTYA